MCVCFVGGKLDDLGCYPTSALFAGLGERRELLIDGIDDAPLREASHRINQSVFVAAAFYRPANANNADDISRPIRTVI